MRTLWLGVLLAVAIGCDGAVKDESPPITEAQALDIARRVIASKEPWAESAKYHKPTWGAREKYWYILVEPVPKTPESGRLVIMDHTGKVTSYVHEK